MIKLDKNWTFYLARPFSLFGASLWHAWYASSEFQETFDLGELDTL
jgi:hypothetical protein